MTIKQLIEQYQKRILVANDKKSVTAEIIKEINNLTYTESNLPIIVEDKKRILTSLRQEVITESHEIFAQDNKEHLELIDQAIKMLGGK